MPKFIDPTGKSTFGIGICARCSRKFSLDDLMPDPNSPGLMVCAEDRDDYDPYRLPARQTEDIALPFTRPDSPLDGFGQPILLSYALTTEEPNYIFTESGDYIYIEEAP